MYRSHVCMDKHFYLRESDIELLDEIAVATGKSKSRIVQEGIREVAITAITIDGESEGEKLDRIAKVTDKSVKELLQEALSKVTDAGLVE